MNKKQFARIRSNLIESILIRKDDYNRIHIPVTVFWNREFGCLDVQRRDNTNSFIYVYINEWSRKIEVWESFAESGGNEERLGLFDINNVEAASEFTFNCLFRDDEIKRKIDWGMFGSWIFILTICVLCWYWIANIVMNVGN